MAWRSCAWMIGVVLWLVSAAGCQTATTYTFENLGRPMQLKPVPIQAVTANSKGQVIAWGDVRDATRFELVGVDTATGESITLDLEYLGRSSQIRMKRGHDGNLYVYAGNPAHFLRYDIEQHKLEDLGVPADPARYILGDAFSPDGKFYIGTYPATNLACVDTTNGRVITIGSIAKDKREMYIINPAVGDDGVVYLPIGLHHAELWSFDPETCEKKQTLNADLMAHQGRVEVFTAEDGQVYGYGFDAKFKCLPDRIELLDDLPAPRRDQSQITINGLQCTRINPDGKLVIRDTHSGDEHQVQSDVVGEGVLIYSIAGIHDGKLWGGGFSPARLWTLDLQTGRAEDWGQLVKGGTQIYDILFHQRGLILSSYVGANLDLVDPRTRQTTHIDSLDRFGQERIPQLALAPDGCIYAPTIPVKGHLDGGIMRLDPSDMSCEVFTPIIKDLSPTRLVVLPQLNQLFVVTTVSGGTSALPVRDEALAFLWNLKTHEVVWQKAIVPGTKFFRGAVLGHDGLIYGAADSQHYFVFDPVKRSVLHVGDLPQHEHGSNIRFATAPAGPDRLIYGLLEGEIFAIDPADCSVKVVARHPTVLDPRYDAWHGTQAFWAAPDGTLYYGAGSELWRVTINR